MTKKPNNYIVTFGTEMLIMLLGFMLFRYANQIMNEYGFSEYTIFRRTISLIVPLMMIGLGVAIPRFVSLHNSESSFFNAGLIWVLIAGGIIFVVLTIFQFYFADVFFGDRKFNDVVVAIGVLLPFMGVHAIIYGFLRGKMNALQANLAQLLNVGIIPIVVLFFSSSVVEIIYLNVIGLFLSCLVFSVLIIRQYEVQFSYTKFRADSKTLLTYGLPRVLGDFALLVLLSLPTYIYLRIDKDLLVAGDIAYGITLLNISAAAFSPLSIVLLPEITTFIANKRDDLIKRRFKHFVLAAVVLTIFGYGIYYLFTDFILSILLGNAYHPSIKETSLVILLGCFGYGLYIILRSFLDAIHVKAKNSINLIIVLVVYVILIFIMYLSEAHLNAYLYCFAASLTLLGLLTLVQTYRAINRLKWE